MPDRDGRGPRWLQGLGFGRNKPVAKMQRRRLRNRRRLFNSPECGFAERRTGQKQKNMEFRGR